MPMPGPPGGPYPAGPPRPWQHGRPYDPYERPAESHPQPAEPSADPWGQPEPWGQSEPWDEPQQWGQPEPWGGAPAQHDRQSAFDQEPTQHLPVIAYRRPPAYGQPPAYAESQAYGPPPADPQTRAYPQPHPPRRRRTGLMISLVVALAVLLGGGAVLTGVYLASNKHADARMVQSGPSAPTITAGPSAAAGAPAPTVPGTRAPTSGAGDNGGNDALTAQVGDCLVNQGSNEAPTMREVTCAADTYEVLERIPLTTDKSRCNGVPGYTHNFFFDSSVDADDLVLCLKYRK